MSTTLGLVIEFLKDFGFFDVILPFLLVFAIVFGVLQKTKIFGIADTKNIDSMVAFSIAFFVIAASNIVQIIQVSIPQVILILIAVISLLMLVGSIMTQKESTEKGILSNGWVKGLTGIFFLALIMIFFNSLGWLQPIVDYIMSTSTGVGLGIFLLILTIVTVIYIVGGFSKTPSSEGKTSSPGG